MFTRLLVGLDGSPSAQQALEAALGLAARFRSTLVLAAITDLRMLEAPLYGAGPIWSEGMPAAPAVAELGALMEERAGQTLAAATARAAAAGVSCETARAAGVVDEELLLLLEHADALVVGRRGELHAEPGTLGAVTAHVIRHAEKPILVAGDHVTAGARPVVAVDGGTTSGNALALAAQYAERAGAPLDVVHVADDAATARLVLDGATDFLRGRHLACIAQHLTGPIVETIAAHLAATGADLLFAGAHGGRQRRQLFVGSHAERLLKATPLPTFIVR
jgi:nucleotide-binding universal stress UspA family protein